MFSLAAAAAAGAAPRVVSRVAIHPDANDVTAAATASSRSRVVAALGTAAVPGRVHFLVSDAPGAWTHDGAFALPAGAGAVRSAAVVEFARDGARHPTETYFALGTDQKPGLIVPAGALAGTPLVLEKGEDVLATAVASEAHRAELGTGGNEFKSTPCFVFATWTSPSRLVRVDVDEETRALRRAATTTLPLGVNRVRAAVADPRRLSFGDGSLDADGSRSSTDLSGGAPPFARVAHFASDTSPSALVTVRTHDLAIVDALIFPSSSDSNDSNATTDGSRVFKGAILPLKETEIEGGAASYWVTRPDTTLRRRANGADDVSSAPSASRGSTLFRVTHRRPDGGGAAVTGTHAFRATERNVAAVSVERTNASAFGSDAAVVYVAFDAAADGDASVVALAERRDRRTGAFAGFARIATVAVPGARALTLVRVADGVATYATRGSPAELVEVDFFNRRTTTSALGDDAVVAMRGPDASASEARASLESFESSEILCVAFLNATHFGATFLFAGGRVGAGGRRLVSAALAARGAAKGETWRARPC